MFLNASLQVFAALVCVSILPGCTARSIQLRNEDRETIKIVRISEDVKVTDELMVRDNRGLAMFGGLLVGGLILAAFPDNHSVFVDFVKQGGNRHRQNCYRSFRGRAGKEKNIQYYRREC